MWTTWISAIWYSNDSICLQFTLPLIVQGATNYYSQPGSGLIYGYDYCRRSEDSLSNCRVLSNKYLGECGHHSDVGVQCEGTCGYLYL